ncbi:hypothetical protein CANARDRAFT_222438 [[Candida] arabinofermentans NRRL YB-2248]|uniref:6-phosphofructo-2-kinase domain-containing protein n=1 Tax=[Candida] arabinofermentans NRRL YB-2248 TaxID=983967 RepID=A0A1E4SZV6_9ASCO|nr:hypothetical protein CANARDRAFT_222438 [[Candida] arabinofermentans NRRL YB-2248]
MMAFNSSTNTTNPSSLSSSKLNSPTLLSRQPSYSALTSAISIPGQTSTLEISNSELQQRTNSPPHDYKHHRHHRSITDNLLSPTEDKSNEVLKLVIICVGLPARGKSYITKKLQRYLNWMQYNTKIFNVGNTRRQVNEKPSDYPIQGPTSDATTSTTTSTTSHDASFFDPLNTDNLNKREQWARETLDNMVDFLLLQSGNVGIFDATNTTKLRRSWIIETVNSRTNGYVKILFLESICTDLNLIEKNIKLKLSGPDYKSMNRTEALNDFKNRLKNYEKVYETIDEEEEKENLKYDIQYIKIINAGKKIISYNISGYLSSQCVFFLLNFNLSDRQIWLSTNGESEFNVQNRKGGDSSITKKGENFAKSLSKFISKKRQEFKLNQLNKDFINDEFCFKSDDDTLTAKTHSHNNFDTEFNIWTSNLKRTIQTASFFKNFDDLNNNYHIKSFRMLNDLGCGSVDSIKEEDFRLNYSMQYKDQLMNKLSFRFPGLGGESYLDVIARLRPIIIELERLKDHVLIISHRVIIRVLLCYFMNLNKEMLTELDVQHGYLYCIEPKPYGLDLKIWQYDESNDEFYEVDEIEIMKKKRKRASISIGSNYRPILKKFNDNSNSTSEDDDDDDDDDLAVQSSFNESTKQQFQNLFIQRSDSQCYEFSNSTNNSSPTLSKSNSYNIDNSNSNNNTSSSRLKISMNNEINEINEMKKGDKLENEELEIKVNEILKNEKLVEMLRSRLCDI